VGKVVGKLSQGRWGQVHDFYPEDEQKRRDRGRLVATISLAVAEGEQVEAVMVGREALSRLQELYYGETDLSARDQLKTAIGAMEREFPGVELAAAVISGDTVHLGVGGGAGVWVSREGGKQGWLVKPGGVAGENPQQCFSGKLAMSEIIILGTREFWAGVSERFLSNAVAKMESNFSEAIEMIVSEVQAGEGEGGGAGAVIKVQNLEIENKPNVEEEAEEPKIENKQGGQKWGKWTEGLKKITGKIYLKQGDKQAQQKKMLYLGLGFMAVVFLFFGGGQLWNQRKQQAGSETTVKLEKMQYDFNEAKAMAGLNPVRSRELLNQVKQALTEFSDDKKNKEIEAIKNEWQGVWNEAAGITGFEQEELIDLSLVRDGMAGQVMAKIEDKLVVLDNKSGRVAEVNPKTGAGTILAGGDELLGARQIITYPGRVMVLGKDKIWEISGGEIKIRLESDEVAAAADAKMWAGNIYLLETNNDGGMIWRYQAAGEGFSVAKEWLADGRTSELAGGKTMAIDGSIWVVVEKEARGETETLIIKYTRGVKEEVTISGLDEKLPKIKLFTNENSENLYLLDTAKSRIVVTNKKGEYLKQYQAAILGKADDLVVDEELGVGYILGEGKVWRFGF